MHKKGRPYKWRTSAVKREHRRNRRFVKAFVSAAISFISRPRYSALLLKELAAIQPLERPEGSIFYLEPYRREEEVDA